MAGREEINQEIERIFQRVREGRATSLSTFSERILAKMDPKLAEAIRVIVNATKDRAGKPPANAHAFKIGLVCSTQYIAWCTDDRSLAHEGRIFERLSTALADEKYGYGSSSYTATAIPTNIRNVLAGKVIDCKPYPINTKGEHSEIIAMLDREEVLLGRKYSPYYLSIDAAPPHSAKRDMVLVKAYRPYVAVRIERS